MTGISELGHPTATSVASEHVRLSVVGGHTQLDVALPVDVPVAGLVADLVKLMRSRDAEESTDSRWPAASHAVWVLSRLDPLTPLEPNETLRAAGVADGELLHLTQQRALSAPILYDDVVDAAARLNKAAYAGWNAAAAQWTSFAGIGLAALVWVYLLVVGAQRMIVAGLAAVVVAAMVGAAALAHRWYGRADIGAAVGWSSIPISAATALALLRGFGGYGIAIGCASLLVLAFACYWAVGAGAGGWGYLTSGVLFAGGGLAVLGHTLGVSTRTVGVALAVAAALACPTVARLTGSLARVEPSVPKPDADGDALVLLSSFTPQSSSAGLGATDSALVAMPTAEAVWARVRSATLTASALYAGLAVSVSVGAVTALCTRANWAALAFALVCAAALGAQAPVPGSALERVSLGVPAAALVVVGCVSVRGGTTAIAWAGFAALLAVAAAASVTGLLVAVRNQSHRWATALTYLRYPAYAALIPVALWAADVYAQLEVG